VRGTLDWGAMGEKRTHPNTNIEKSKWDFGPTSVILYHNSVGAVAYVGKKCVLKVKLLSVPKKRPVQNTSNKRKVPAPPRYYSREFRPRNSWYHMLQGVNLRFQYRVWHPAGIYIGNHDFRLKINFHANQR
jgi:hypothetical protein